MMTETEATAKLLADYNKKKPIIPIFIGGPAIEKGLTELKNNGMVNFAFPKDAVEALDNLARGASKKEAPVASKSERVKVVEKMMPFTAMHDLFKEYGLHLPGVLVKEKKDLAEAMKKAGEDPWTLKAMSPDIIHKTDMAAVKLDIKSLKGAEKAWDDIEKSIHKKKPDAVLDGMLMQTMVPGKEIIIGMKRDATFGPTVLFGLGGIYTEALKDTSLRIAPVSKEEADKMVRDIRGIHILSGLRGEKPVDFETLADIIIRLSKLAIEHQEIKEIDLNPVMANEKEAVIVDARVII
jgi:acyl-CoA synthetase (NDP forming)